MNTYKNKLFWKLTLFSLALFGARSIFRHQDATLPKWMERTIDAKAHYGDIYSINPAMIIFLVPLLQHVLRAYDSYDTVTAGTLVIAIAPTVLSVANPSYTAAAFFMIIMSLGEAIYSPRSTQYVLSLAPVGGEGVFGVLAAVPLFMVKVLTGGMSGNLLDTYCPANDTSRCKMVWTFIGVVASTSFLSLLLARKWLRVPNGPYPSRALFDDTDVHAHIERYGNSDSDDAEILSDGSDPDDTALQHAEPVYGTPNDDDRLYAITTDHIQPRRKSKT